MLGTLTLPLRKGRDYVVIGGPSYDNIPGTVFVKMAAEININCAISIPTPDFNTPNPEQLRKGLIEAVDAMVQGKSLYVGCMAGKGRTGLFLAVLAKAMGIADPVGYVRANYYGHAVETADQMQFVKDFPIPTEVKNALRWAKIKSYFSGRKLLTRLPDTAMNEVEQYNAKKKIVWPYA